MNKTHLKKGKQHMKRLKKIVIALLFAIIICQTTPQPIMPTVEAHSGRTDSQGGHKDNKNKSGLGGYHYHCGGHPAHLHTNGVCPYAGVDDDVIYYNNSYTQKYKMYADEYQNRQALGYFIPEIYTPVYNKVSYNISACLSLDDYINYLQLSSQDKEDFKKYVIIVLYDQEVTNLHQQQAAYTNAIFDPIYYQTSYPDLYYMVGNYEALYNHFNSNGMAEGRQGCATFNVYIYMQNNPDLTSVFGDNLIAYYQHYLNYP